MIRERLLFCARHLVLFIAWVGVCWLWVSWLDPGTPFWQVTVGAAVYYAFFFLASLGGFWRRCVCEVLPVIYMRVALLLPALLVALAGVGALVRFFESVQGSSLDKFPYGDLAIAVGLLMGGASMFKCSYSLGKSLADGESSEQ